MTLLTATQNIAISTRNRWKFPVVLQFLSKTAHVSCFVSHTAAFDLTTQTNLWSPNKQIKQIYGQIYGQIKQIYGHRSLRYAGTRFEKGHNPQPNLWPPLQ
jgi:hypothetical protein